MPNAPASNPTVTIDGSDQLAELVRDCPADGSPIVDYGVAHGGLGHPPPDRHVRLVQQGDLIEHYERDLVVRAGAGVAVGRLRERLRGSNQFLPIDADDDVTLGEAVMHNVYGPLRVGYGSLRDLVLGLRYVDGSGGDIHVGGRTVKNVAGYDVSRFMVGSLGELGCVYEAMLRTSAVPQGVLIAEVCLDGPALIDAIVTDLLVSDAAPVQVSLRMRESAAVVRVGYFGHREGCRAGLESLKAFISGVPGVEIAGSRECLLDDDLSERSESRFWRREASSLVRVIVPPAVTGAVCEELSRWASEHINLNIEALPVHGCVFAGGGLDAGASVDLDEQVRRIVGRVGGVRIWHARPGGTEAIDPFGPPQPDWPLLARLKHAMDPAGIFNPGRFLPTGGQWA